MPAKRALGAGRDLAHVIVVADAHEDDVGALGRRGGVGRLAPPWSFDPGRGLGGGPVIDRDLMPGLGEMPRHRIAHHAQSEKCQLHATLPLTA